VLLGWFGVGHFLSMLHAPPYHFYDAYIIKSCALLCFASGYYAKTDWMSQTPDKLSTATDAEMAKPMKVGWVLISR
jgi:hypothetical protein